MQASTAVGPARQLYCGRGFTEALETAPLTGHSLWILSAGMGLITAADHIPAYDLTLAGTSTNSIRSKIVPGPFRADRWWSHINKLREEQRSLSWLLHRHPKTTLVLTLSAAYAELVKTDLEKLDVADLNRLRIIGLASDDPLPLRLKPLWMPYDDRLDGPDSQIAGTKSDFPQRATRHFIEMILASDPTAPAEQHRTQVEAALANKRRPCIPQRERMSDQEILTVITQEWDKADNSASRMLRILRDDRRIACEQKRFSVLFKQARARRSAR
ncbi:MAG: hypothetical protein U1F76_14405 [Candidatus Competibacteraceae bacterium]